MLVKKQNISDNVVKVSSAFSLTVLHWVGTTVTRLQMFDGESSKCF